MKHFYLLSILPFALCLVLFSGCGGKTVPLSGKITFADDGSALKYGIIVFDSGTVRSKGIIKEDGTYTAGTFTDTDGIPPGTYQVSLSGTEEPSTAKSADPMSVPPGKPVIDPKYANASTSGLTLMVDGKTGTFNVKVERPKK